MTTLNIDFQNAPDDNSSLPYILGQEPIDFKFDGKEGSIFFNGYYYVEDHAPPYPEDEDLDLWDRPRRYKEWLPRKACMFTSLRETEPSKIETHANGSTYTHYNYIEKGLYIIEIYKRVIYECTNQYSELEDEGMQVCFFPTDKQTIYFRVLENL